MFSPSVVFVFLSFLSFSFIFLGDYKGVLPTEESVFLSSVSLLYFFSFYLLGVMRGVFFPLIVFIMDFAVNYKVLKSGWLSLKGG